jgi:O-succinylbenzoate synthase
VVLVNAAAPGLAGIGVRSHRVRVPLRVPLGGRTARDATLLEGPAGWGEFSPLPGYPCDPRHCEDAALEAVLVGWPAPLRHAVPVNGLVPAVDPETAARLASEAGAAGMTTVKVKVGGGPLDEDADRVAAVREALGRTGRIRLDANGAWDLDGAVAAIARLAVFDIELVEQPVADLDDLARVRRRVSIPVAADECVRTLADARRLAALEAADAVVVKVQPLGGVRAALRVVEAAGVAAIVSSLYETSVGLAAGVALAAALPDLPYACGLGTAALLAGDVVANPLIPEGGTLPVRRVEPDPALIARWEIPA